MQEDSLSSDGMRAAQHIFREAAALAACAMKGCEAHAAALRSRRRRMLHAKRKRLPPPYLWHGARKRGRRSAPSRHAARPALFCMWLLPPARGKWRFSGKSRMRWAKYTGVRSE